MRKRKRHNLKKLLIAGFTVSVFCGFTYIAFTQHKAKETTYAFEHFYGDKDNSESYDENNVTVQIPMESLNKPDNLNNNIKSDKEYNPINTGNIGNSIVNPDTDKDDELEYKEEEFIEITSHDLVELDTDPESITVLVNKELNLPSNYIPKDLVEPNVLFSFSHYDQKRLLRKEAAKALEYLFKAAQSESLTLYGVSGYRSYYRQKSIFTTNVLKKGLEQTTKYSATPGYSEHQTGLSMDVSTKSIGNRLISSFADTKEGIWLAENAHLFGYILRYPKGKSEITGYYYEPWHIRYVGKALAKYLYENDLTLEEYYSFKPTYDYFNDFTHDNLEEYINLVPTLPPEQEVVVDDILDEDELVLGEDGELIDGELGELTEGDPNDLIDNKDLDNDFDSKNDEDSDTSSGKKKGKGSKGSKKDKDSTKDKEIDDKEVVDTPEDIDDGEEAMDDGEDNNGEGEIGEQEVIDDREAIDAPEGSVDLGGNDKQEVMGEDIASGDGLGSYNDSSDNKDESTNKVTDSDKAEGTDIDLTVEGD